MFIQFKNYRISFVEHIGETGFKTTIYKGTKRVGKASREDGKIHIDDIEVDISSKEAEREIKNMIKARNRLSIDGEEVPWSLELVVYCLMENKSIYENVKKALQSNRLVVKFKNEDYFSVLNGFKNTPKDLAILKKEKPHQIDKTGQELIEIYEKIRSE